MTETTCQLDNTISLPILVVVCVALLTNGATFRLSKQALLREVVTGAMQAGSFQVIHESRVHTLSGHATRVPLWVVGTDYMGRSS